MKKQLIFLGLSFVLAVTLISQTQTTTTTPTIAELTTINSQGTVTLSLTSSSSTYINGNNLTVNLETATALESVTAISFEITYDPTLLTFVSYNPSTAFPNALSATSASNGVLSGAYGVELSSGGVNGNYTIGTFTFTAIGTGSTTLNITSNTLVAATGSTGNVLGQVDSKTLTLTTATVTSTSANTTCAPEVYLNNTTTPTLDSLTNYLSAGSLLSDSSSINTNANTYYLQGVKITNTSTSAISPSSNTFNIVMTPSNTSTSFTSIASTYPSTCQQSSSGVITCSSTLTSIPAQTSISSGTFATILIGSKSTNPQTTDSTYTLSLTDGNGNTIANCGTVTYTRSATLSGDFNYDDSVDVLDYAYLIKVFGTTDSTADMNSNGTIDIFDYSLFIQSYVEYLSSQS